MSLPPKIDRIAFVASSTTNPNDVHVCALDGSNERQLTHVNDALLAEIALPAIERRITLAG